MLCIKTITFLVEGPGEEGEISTFFFDGFLSGFHFVVGRQSFTVLGISSIACLLKSISKILLQEETPYLT